MGHTSVVYSISLTFCQRESTFPGIYLPARQLAGPEEVKGMDGTPATTVTYRCYRWDSFRGRRREYIGECLRTSSVEELKAHRDAVVEDPGTARSHLLDVLRFNEQGELIGMDGMCLPDAVFDAGAGTVEHFLHAGPKEARG